MTANFLRKLKPSAQFFRRLMNLWSPYRGAGIQVMHIAPDFRSVKVKLKRKWYNTNYVGTQFGGSIYAMTDPFYMLMLINNLGGDYIVWDKGATIDFVHPGKTELFVELQLDETLLTRVKEKTAGGEKYIFDLPVEVRDATGELVAAITKKLYVRKKQKQNGDLSRERLAVG